ncbi:DNA-binding response regulator [Frankia sp. CcI49]|nr:DNA-binding response regulator [Frankia sp. CcI49]
MSHGDADPGARDGTGADRAGVGGRVVVVDDHPLWREALSRDLTEAGFSVVGTAGSVAQALRVLAATRPEVLVLDLGLPDGPGVEVIRALVGTTEAPNALTGAPVSVLVVSASGEQADVLDAVKAGASGYLLKSARPEELVNAVRRTARGAAVFTAGLAALVLGEASRASREPGSAAGSGSAAEPRLTAREVEVLRLVAKGLSARDAARQLGVSHRTVQNHVHNVLAKLQLRNRVELTRFALREGYDDVP